MTAAGNITSTASDFELYGYWRTPAAFRVDVALALKGLRAEEQFVDDDAEFDRLGRDVVGSNAEAMTKL